MLGIMVLVVANCVMKEIGGVDAFISKFPLEKVRLTSNENYFTYLVFFLCGAYSNQI